MQWEDLVEEFARFQTSDPNTCVSLGIDRMLDDLPNPSPEHIS